MVRVRFDAKLPTMRKRDQSSSAYLDRSPMENMEGQSSVQEDNILVSAMECLQLPAGSWVVPGYKGTTDILER